jgi:DNA-binding transcriptional regulator YhcF (GntR family)
MRFPFTPAARDAFNRARNEAVNRRHVLIGTEHVLLGLLGDTDVRDALLRLDVDLAVLGDRARSLCEPSGGGRALPDPASDPRVRRVLEMALRRREDAGDAAQQVAPALVGPIDLLRALLSEGSGHAARLLEEAGVTLQRVDEWSSGTMHATGREATVRIDDDAPLSIHEQIVAQVAERIATGSWPPNTPLPTVRRLADELAVATGTVARADRALEAAGLIVTDGARGTRVASSPGRRVTESEQDDLLYPLLRPVVVSSFHAGVRATELRAALTRAMRGVYRDEECV